MRAHAAKMRVCVTEHGCWYAGVCCAPVRQCVCGANRCLVLLEFLLREGNAEMVLTQVCVHACDCAITAPREHKEGGSRRSVHGCHMRSSSEQAACTPSSLQIQNNLHLISALTSFRLVNEHHIDVGMQGVLATTVSMCTKA